MRAVKDFNGLYSVTKNGRVYSHRSKKYLAPRLGARGYYSVVLRANGVIRPVTIHRLVAVAYLPNPANKSQINHIDTVKTNNRLSNLEWVTYSENMAHAKKHGLLRKANGENHPQAKLDWAKVNYIRSKVGELSNGQMARQFGVTPSVVWDVVHNKSWRIA